MRFPRYNGFMTAAGLATGIILINGKFEHAIWMALMLILSTQIMILNEK